jgi:hypothetical protein
MAQADVTKAIEHPLIDQDAVGNGQVLQQIV